MSNAELVRKYTEEFKNYSNFDIVDEVCSENFVHHLPIPGLPEGRAGFKALGQFVTGAIGDITVTIELIVADDGLVANSSGVNVVAAAPVGRGVRSIERHRGVLGG